MDIPDNLEIHKVTDASTLEHEGKTYMLNGAGPTRFCRVLLILTARDVGKCDLLSQQDQSLIFLSNPGQVCT